MMLNNESYQANKKPNWQAPEVGKPAADKYAKRTPAEEAAVKSRIDAAWGEKQPDVSKNIADDSGDITSKVQPATAQKSTAYPDVKPYIK
jgi:hypothetical protein